LTLIESLRPPPPAVVRFTADRDGGRIYFGYAADTWPAGALPPGCRPDAAVLVWGAKFPPIRLNALIWLRKRPQNQPLAETKGNQPLPPSQRSPQGLLRDHLARCGYGRRCRSHQTGNRYSGCPRACSRIVNPYPAGSFQPLVDTPVKLGWLGKARQEGANAMRMPI